MPSPKSTKSVRTRSPAQKANDLKLKKMHSRTKIMNAPSKYVKSIATKSNAKKAAGLAGLIAALALVHRKKSAIKAVGLAATAAVMARRNAMGKK
jgi:hypothetical protein